ncbi:hypothetical protein [uncultured Fibrobacter sp.]|nr:hypothetical protein [uncultured Fibrobacter sp.]
MTLGTNSLNNEEKHRNDIEIDFVIQSGGRLNFKIMPIEVKSGKR